MKLLFRAQGRQAVFDVPASYFVHWDKAGWIIIKNGRTIAALRPDFPYKEVKKLLLLLA